MAPQVTVGEFVYHVARSVQESTSSTTLPIGAIIGIACGGGVFIFGLLTILLIYCARRRNRRVKRSKGRPDLDEDAAVGNEMRSVHSLERNRTKSSADNPFRDPSLRTAPSHSNLSAATSTINLLPPHQISYSVTKFHDSWPLVDWAPNQSIPFAQPQGLQTPPAQKVTNLPAQQRSAPHHYKQPSWSQIPTVPLTSDGDVYNPVSSSAKPTEKRQDDEEVLAHIRPQTLILELQPIAPKQAQISPTRSSPQRRSVSDNHLSSILRSTSQRLRDAKGLPRAASILSQVSGQPPSEKPPTPRQEHHRTMSLTERSEYEESVKSSVLEMFSRTPSPAKQIATGPRADASTPTKKGQSLQKGEMSDEDSLYGDTPDMVIPAALTSPSKSGLRSEQRHRMRISSAESPVSIRIDKNNRTSTSAFDGRNIFAKSVGDSSIDKRDASSNVDPFVSSQSLADRDVSKISPPRPQLAQRKTTFGQSRNSNVSLDSATALKIVSGNGSPLKSAVKLQSPTTATFDWSKESNLVVKQTPSPQQPKILKKRGHQRSKTIRLSGLQRPRSVSVLKEENEDDSGTESAVEQPSPERAASPTSVYSKSQYSARPLSVTKFPTFLAPPTISLSASEDSPTLGGTRSNISRGSYSATMSFYDFYSSDPASNSTISSMVEPKAVNENKANGHGTTFSVQHPNDPNKFVFPPRQLPGLTTDGPTDEDAKQGNDSSVSDQSGPRELEEDYPVFTTAPPAISRLHGPRSLPRHAPRDSIQASIAQLRRMNSAVSSYSTAHSATGDEGSPTLPALRGGGISPTKKGGLRGSQNYLSIDVNKSSPRNTRSTVLERAQTLEMAAQKERESRELDRTSPRAQSSPTAKHSHTKSSQDIPTPDRAFYSSAALSATPVLVTPTKTSKNIEMASPLDNMSSGLKIQGLRLPLRNQDGSPVKTKSSTQNIFALAAEQEKRERSERWSSATPKPPKGMEVVRPQEIERLQQPTPRNTTPPKWGSGWSTAAEAASPTAGSNPNRNRIGSGFGEDIFYQPSPTYEQLTFESPTRASFEAAVKDSPLRLPKMKGSFETPRGVPSAKIGKPPIMNRVDSLRWKEGNLAAMSGNAGVEKTTNGTNENTQDNRNSIGLYDSDGFLRSSPERMKILQRTGGSGMENMI